ncbi:MAG: hypothetical protein M1136_08225 [Chloroflexi bacterium]|nr:hypothetical protein [Chloroflexota bacterium]MCL5075618.1 hypothetical protein [Chloroflexota bacterium]
MKRITVRALLILLPLLLLTITSCISMTDNKQGSAARPVGEIYGSQQVGQSFVSHYAGLSHIDVLLATYARQNTEEVSFHLKHKPSDPKDLITITVNASAIQDNAFHSFGFPPQPDSAGKSYFFYLKSLRSRPGDAITVWYDPVDVYGEGSRYLNGEPTSGDLAFATYYEYSPMRALADVWHGLSDNWELSLSAFLLFVLPGYALLSLLSLYQRDIIERFIISIGLSVALIPLLLFMATMAGAKLNKDWLLGLIAASTIVVAGHHLANLRLRPKPTSATRGMALESEMSIESNKAHELPSMSREELIISYSVLGVIFLVSMVVRLLVVRHLMTPMWGDSYHHTMIARLIVDKGSVPDSYLPYAPLFSFTYHFGFHAVVAFFHWLSDRPLTEMVILVGQILNGFAVLGSYLLAVKLTGDKRAGLVAALITGTISLMPAYYVNWGRYPQLAGQVILPFALVSVMEAVEWPGRDWRRLGLAAVFLAGLTLTHYRVLLFSVAFIWLYLLWVTWIRRRRMKDKRSLCEPWIRGMIMAIAAIVLVAPWLANILINFLPKFVSSLAIAAKTSPAFLAEYNAIGDLWFFVSPYLLCLAIVGALLSIFLRQSRVILIILWVILLFLMANPGYLRLPGTGAINNFTILIALYLPISILIGFLAGRAIEAITIRLPRLRHLLALALIIVALLGAKNMLSLLDPSYALVLGPDEKAMEWIRSNTPVKAKFLVNSFFARGGAVVVGSDAGWWIPLLADRQNTVPPDRYTAEKKESRHESQVAALAKATEGPLDSADSLSLFQRQGITHVYIGARGGIIKPEELLSSPHYRLIYHDDGVWIFKIEYGTKVDK